MGLISAIGWGKVFVVKQCETLSLTVYKLSRPDGRLLSGVFGEYTRASHGGGGPALYTLHMNELGGRQPQRNLTSK